VSMAKMKEEEIALEDDPLWFKDAIIYELHVRAFYDSDGDGIGDFQGLTEKLDYLQELGVTVLWLLPFYPSPLKDDGYDIADYTNINPAYGTLQSFKTFLKEAHKRGLRVITELVINHTSDQHAWFQRARRSQPGTNYRNFYVWSDTPDKYKDARIIFKDFELSNWTYDPVAKAYFWHRFYSHQPDLNFENPEVRKALFQVLDFWLGMGIDGLRLDAVPYLYEHEGTNCENLPETHKYLRELRAYVDKKYKNRMLLAEANQWPEDAAAYFSKGDECHMNFHFPLMPRLFMAIQMEDSFPILDILEQTPSIPENCQWAVFLRNHDELTLEMVTDEDRDYMYRIYATDPQARINLGIRRRLTPLMMNNRRKLELMNGLLLSMPGTPVLYYGDEIGMGDNIYLGDRNGVRTPMQWSGDRNAGFSRSSPQRLFLPVITEPEYHFEAINVEAQQSNPHSLLWWTKRIISLRKQHRAFGRGSLEFLLPTNNKVLVFMRRYQENVILIIANLSRFVQSVELDLSQFRDRVPIEMFGRTELHPIGDAPYFITLGPHTFHWIALEQKRAVLPAVAGEIPLPNIKVNNRWEEIFYEAAKQRFEELLPIFLKSRYWFGGKRRQIKTVQVLDTIPVPYGSSVAQIAMIGIEYSEGEPETYVLPLTFVPGDEAQFIRQGINAVVRITGKVEGVVYDAMREKDFSTALLETIVSRRTLKSSKGKVEITNTPTPLVRKDKNLEPSVTSMEHSHTSIVYGDQLVLKLFRRVDKGINSELEISSFLSEKASFIHTPILAGALQYSRIRHEPTILAILKNYVPNRGEAWQLTIEALDRYLESVLMLQMKGEQPPAISNNPVALIDEEPPRAAELLGMYLEAVRIMGHRTAELHITLASENDDPNFTPEPFSTLYQRSIYQSMRNHTRQVFNYLRKSIADLPEAIKGDAQKLLGLQDELFSRFRIIYEQKINAQRIRIHGDYNLRQLLYTGDDFMIIDFEGDPNRPLSERRLKRSALRDIAVMLRSFHYAAYTSLFKMVNKYKDPTLERPGVVDHRAEKPQNLEPWTRYWIACVSSRFLKSYLELARKGSFLPQDRREIEVLLNTYILERALSELNFELNNRPERAIFPIKGILEVLET
jgi:maltose alpha-D-glucosyltransferase / alpha-amylase